MIRALLTVSAAETELARISTDVAPEPLRLGTNLFGTSDPSITAQTHEYARPDGTPLLLDLFHPADGAASTRPLVVIIHGGSWRGGDRKQLPALGEQLTQDGYIVAAISYRLAPANTFPAALQDVNAAVTWLKRHATDLRIDTTRIVLLGRSAGGQLALLAAYTRHDPAIRGVISFYGPTDLRWGWEHPTNRA